MPASVNIFTKQNDIYVINAHFTFFIMQCSYTHNINKNGSISDLFYRVIWLYFIDSLNSPAKVLRYATLMKQLQETLQMLQVWRQSEP